MSKQKESEVPDRFDFDCKILPACNNKVQRLAVMMPFTNYPDKLELKTDPRGTWKSAFTEVLFSDICVSTVTYSSQIEQMGKGLKFNALHTQPSGNELCMPGVIQVQLCVCRSKVEELYLSPECVQLLRVKLTSAFDASASWAWDQIRMLRFSHSYEGLHKIKHVWYGDKGGEPTNGRNAMGV